MKTITAADYRAWHDHRIRQDQIDKYLVNGKDFIDDAALQALLASTVAPDARRVADILDKAYAIKALSLEETAQLLAVTDPELLAQMTERCGAIKHKVYDNRIVTFAPLYLSNQCVNNCLYCGFRSENSRAQRAVLNLDQVREETRVLAGTIGHKRLIVVYGEHPTTDIDYMTDTIRAIYSVKEKARVGFGQIRRVNVNAAPLAIEDLQKLKQAGIGTYQVFQETYHRDTYYRVHPQGTIKADYRWRLYCMHRAMEAGIDDVGIGALFGLGDWRFEVLALVAHAHELERCFGVGPHTLSFPRIEPAHDAPLAANLPHRVSDNDFQHIIRVLRLAVPYSGMIITARETEAMRRQAISLGYTQTDASTRLGIGSYSQSYEQQQSDRQQFLLGDTRSLDTLIRDFAAAGIITSFCTAGYRCGRTGECIMDLLREGSEGKLCKLNAVITFKEWLDDFATEETQRIAAPLLEREIAEVKATLPKIFPQFIEAYERTAQGARDLYF